MNFETCSLQIYFKKTCRHKCFPLNLAKAFRKVFSSELFRLAATVILSSTRSNQSSTIFNENRLIVYLKMQPTTQVFFIIVSPETSQNSRQITCGK